MDEIICLYNVDDIADFYYRLLNPVKEKLQVFREQLYADKTPADFFRTLDGLEEYLKSFNLIWR